MANVPVRYALAGRKVYAQLKEGTGTGANLTAGGTAVVLHLRAKLPPFASFSLTNSVTIDDPNTGKVNIALHANDFVAAKLQAGKSYWAWYTVTPVPAGSDDGYYPEGDFDTWTLTV